MPSVPTGAATVRTAWRGSKACARPRRRFARGSRSSSLLAGHCTRHRSTGPSSRRRVERRARVRRGRPSICTSALVVPANSPMRRATLRFANTTTRTVTPAGGVPAATSGRGTDVAARPRPAPRAASPRPVDAPHPEASCTMCAADFAFLAMKDRPDYEGASPRIRVVDLFAGGGGRTTGAAEAARRVGGGTTVALAVEQSDSAADVYGLNFPDANLVRSDVVDLFDGSLGTRPSASERKIARQVGEVDLLLAGPPCRVTRT